MANKCVAMIKYVSIVRMTFCIGSYGATMIMMIMVVDVGNVEPHNVRAQRHQPLCINNICLKRCDYAKCKYSTNYCYRHTHTNAHTHNVFAMAG